MTVSEQSEEKELECVCVGEFNGRLDVWRPCHCKENDENCY